MKKFVFIIAFLALNWTVFGQTHTRVYNENIRTLRVAREVIRLDEQEPLHISFDEMSHDVHFYTYTVRMLNSDLLSNEYLQGFPTRTSRITSIRSTPAASTRTIGWSFRTRIWY